MPAAAPVRPPAAMPPGERGPTEERILDAAEALFSRRGLAGTRVREIAEAAGLKAASLYNYYPSKEALYEAVLDRGIRPLTERVAGFAGGAAAEVDALVSEVMTHLAARPQLCRLIYLETLDDGERLVAMAERWFRPLFEQMVTRVRGAMAAEALPPMSPEDVAAAVALFVHLSFGHFALAPLVRETLGVDPATPSGVAAQTRLITQLIQRSFPS